MLRVEERRENRETEYSTIIKILHFIVTTNNKKLYESGIRGISYSSDLDQFIYIHILYKSRRIYIMTTDYLKQKRVLCHSLWEIQRGKVHQNHQDRKSIKPGNNEN